MGNRSPRHLRPGQRNLRGKKTMTVCPCCDPVINHREDVRTRLAEIAARNPEDFAESYEAPAQSKEATQ